MTVFKRPITTISNSRMNCERLKLEIASINLLLVVVAILLTAYALASHQIVINKFKAQEAAERKRDMQICMSLLHQKTVWLNNHLTDYATSDYAYQVVKSPEPGLLRDNLTERVPKHSNVDAVILTDANLRVVVSFGLTGPLKQALLGSWHLRFALAGVCTKGIVRAGTNIYLVATAPAPGSPGKGPTEGALTFAQLLDKSSLSVLANIADLDVAIFGMDGRLISASGRFGENDLPEGRQRAFRKAARTGGAVLQISRDNSRIFAWQRLEDWNGNHVAALVTSTPRITILANLRFARLRSLALIIASLLTALLAALQMRISMLARSAQIDGLTGLHNHRYLQERLVQEIVRAERYGRPLSAALIDIDHFKHINDELGHQVGDQALQQIAHLLGETVRNTDIIARYGGEEFIVIMPETHLEGAMVVAERIRGQVEERVFEARVSGPRDRGARWVTLRFTVSVGVAVFPDHARRADELIMAADLALFAAKHASRNIVRSYAALSGDEPRDIRNPSVIHLSMREGSLSAVRALAAAVDARDPSTRGHSQKVALYSLAIGQALNLSVEETNTLRMAALLHDVGMIAIPDYILQKPMELTQEERMIVRQHAIMGSEILAKAPQLVHVAEIVRHHHEMFDGCGYADGLKGETIPLASRIIAAAEAFDALTSERPYRAVLSTADAVRKMQGLAGSQFDPLIVNSLHELVASGRISQLIETYRDELDLAA
ncbi:MAG: diguanylate cyclase [Armatimonadetes bacterium]|nr:diguanylate cyclase [Armatimonadota bacterium]